jgi:hypothetical protein
MPDRQHTPWSEYWSADPLALHAERPETTRLIPATVSTHAGLSIDTVWHDTTDSWVAAPSASIRIGNPHLITTDAFPDPTNGIWTVRAWAFTLRPDDQAMTDLAAFAIRTDTPHVTARIQPQLPKKNWVELRGNSFYPERFPAERTLQVMGNVVETAAIRVAYRLVGEALPNITLNRLTYGRSVTGLLDGQRFNVRFKGQRAVLTVLPNDRQALPVDSVEVRLPGPYPFLAQLDGSPAERITEALRMLLLAKNR